MVNAGQNCADDVEGSSDVGNPHAYRTGRVAGLAVQIENSRHGLCQQVLTGAGHVGPVLTPATTCAVNQFGMDAGKKLISQPQPIHNAGAKVFEQDIAGLNELQCGLFAERVFQVHGDTAFTPIKGEE